MNTRIAPSPTGYMHIGTARTAYFNWLAARASQGQFILRIDDTDQQRNNQEYIDDIIETMNWLGLNYDQIVYQSKRNDLYTTALNLLTNKGLLQEKDGAIIFQCSIDKMPKIWHDEIGGDIAITKTNLDILSEGIVLLRSDKTPTYHFASCVDDIDLKIDLIIRGVDHLTNTIKQIAIWQAMDYTPPKIAHIGLLHMNGKKMSKRDGAMSVLDLKNKGYSPEAILNFLVRMGWGPKIDDKTTSLLPRKRMLELFLNDGKMRSSAANIDMAKLDAFNRKYKALQVAI